MKKIMVIGGVVYVAVCVVSCVYIIVNPEGYGRLTGKFLTGFFKELDDEQEVIK